jgi:cytochrome c-type biogenesis protein CcmH/NrfF
MKEIDKYLKSLYKRVNATDQEIEDLKTEMKNHLLDTVRELQAEGKSAQESVQIAIERFGDPNQLGRELPEILIVSRRRFSRLILVIAGVALAIIISSSLVYFDNLKKQEKLKQAELTKQTFIQELQKTQSDNQEYIKIVEQIAKLSATYSNNLGQLSKDLKTKYNKSVINQISEMNKIFKYHNGVLIAIAVIAAETNYEYSYYKEIAELGVMKLSDSLAVINLAEKAREAKTQNDKEFIQNQIQQMKSGAEFQTYQEALDYNRQLMKP